MHWVKRADYKNEYKIAVQFEDGILKIIDLEGYLDNGIFVALKELTNFKNFKVNNDTDTIEWENGADLSPDFLYEIGKTIEQDTKVA